MKVLIFFALVLLAVASASVIGPLAAPIALGHLGVPVAGTVQIAGLPGAALIGAHGALIHG